MSPNQVIVLEEHLPVDLTVRQTLWFFKVDEIFLVCQDGDGMRGAREVLVPLQECMYDGK